MGKKIISVRFDRQGRLFEQCSMGAKSRKLHGILDWLGYMKIEKEFALNVKVKRPKVHLESSRQLSLPVFREI